MFNDTPDNKMDAYLELFLDNGQKAILEVLPLTYGYDALRGWLLGTYTLLPVWLELVLLLIFMVVMIFLGARAFRALEHRVRMRGTLGRH